MKIKLLSYNQDNIVEYTCTPNPLIPNSITPDTFTVKIDLGRECIIEISDEDYIFYALKIEQLVIDGYKNRNKVIKTAKFLPY